MRKRRVIVLAAAIVAVLGLIGWAVASLPPAVPDPEYEGHPLSQWLSGFANFPAPYTWDNPGRVPELDSNALPYLIRSLNKGSGVLGTTYSRLWAHLPAGGLRDRLPFPGVAAQIRVNAAVFLSDELRENARPAVPALLHMLVYDAERGPRAEAATALSWIADRNDKKVLETLASAAANETDPWVKKFVSSAIWHLNPEAAAKAGVTNAAAGASPATAAPGASR